MRSIETPAWSDQSGPSGPPLLKGPEGQRSALFDWLCLPPLSHTAAPAPPSECDHHSVHLHSEVTAVSISPIWNRATLALSQFDSVWLHLSAFSPLSISVTKRSTAEAAGRLLTQEPERDTVIKLNGLNMSRGDIFMKPIHKGKARSHTARGSQH